jgi:hypothetical protein
MSDATSQKPLTEYSFEEMGFVFAGARSQEVGIRILERTSAIDYFGDGKPQIGCGLFLQRDCAAVGVLFAVGQLVRKVYTYWLNYHRDFDRQVWRALARQTFLMVRFHASNLQEKRLYLLENSMRDLLEEGQQAALRLPEWSPERFRQMLSDVTHRYGRDNRLWDKLKTGSPVIDLDLSAH